MTINEPIGRLARWANLLQRDRMTIIHRKKKVHSNVDALSRPIMMVTNSADIEEQEDVSPKHLATYEDERLLHFLKTGKHIDGSRKKQHTMTS